MLTIVYDYFRKYIIPFCLIFILLLFCFSSCVFATEDTTDAQENTEDTEQEEEEFSPYVINGVALPLDEDGFRPGDYRGMGTCWEFCQHVYEAIWGQSFSQFHGTRDDVLKDIPIDEDSRSVSIDSAKEFLMKASPGAVVRVQSSPDSMDSSSGNRHSFIVLEIRGDGCVVYHAWSGYVMIEFLTWEDLADRLHETYDYGSFKYIKYPYFGEE